MELLKTLTHKHGTGFFELTQKGFSRGYLIKELKRLREAGLVEKWSYPYSQRDGINTRGSYWVLTEKGRELKDEPN